MNYSEYFIVTTYNTNGTKVVSRYDDLGEVIHTCNTQQKKFAEFGIEKIVVDSVCSFEGRRRFKTYLPL